MDTTTLMITLGSFLAAYINAVFATGGYFLLLAISTWVLPTTIAVPLQPSLIYTSLIARVGFFWSHTNWHMVLTFCLGAVVGVFLGANTFVYLSESLLSLLVGGMMLFMIWMPMKGIRLRIKYPYFSVGIVHAFMTTAIGASAILQTIMLRSPMLKLQITGTLASCFIAMKLMRIVGYASVGFNYLEYLPIIVLASIAGILGTWVGKHTEHHVSEKLFRIIFKWLITFVGLRLIVKGWLLL